MEMPCFFSRLALRDHEVVAFVGTSSLADPDSGFWGGFGSSRGIARDKVLAIAIIGLNN